MALRGLDEHRNQALSPHRPPYDDRKTGNDGVGQAAGRIREPGQR
jgi:hypothetical protein